MEKGRNSKVNHELEILSYFILGSRNWLHDRIGQHMVNPKSYMGLHLADRKIMLPDFTM